MYIAPINILISICIKSMYWYLVAHPVTQVIGEQALVDIWDLSKVAWTCLGYFYTQQWAGAEAGKGIRPAAGTGNE